MIFAYVFIGVTSGIITVLLSLAAHPKSHRKDMMALGIITTVLWPVLLPITLLMVFYEQLIKRTKKGVKSSKNDKVT